MLKYSDRSLKSSCGLACSCDIRTANDSSKQQTIMKHIVQHNRVPTSRGPPQDMAMLLPLLRIDGAITEQLEQQGHFFGKRLTVCGAFQPTGHVCVIITPYSLCFHVYHRATKAPCLISLSAPGAAEIYITAIAACGVCRLCLQPFSTLLSFTVIMVLCI